MVIRWSIRDVTMSDIYIKPVGFVRSKLKNTSSIPMSGTDAIIEIDSQYRAALHGISEFSHLWIISWFHLASRNVLVAQNPKISKFAKSAGVFALRSPSRPNPIALSLVRLKKVDGNRLYISGYDGIDGTPVLDIKPYNEIDIVFSPITAYYRISSVELRKELMKKEALAHHQEDCVYLNIGVRMALLVEERLGRLTSPDLLVTVIGPPCLADTIQGLTRARLANPPRLRLKMTTGDCITRWKKGEQIIEVRLKRRANIWRDRDPFDVLYLKNL